MRNRILTLAALPCLLAASPELLRAEGASKLGVINIQEAIVTTQEGKKALSDIQKKFQPRQQELQRQQQDIQALTDELQKQGPALSDEVQRQKARELEEKQRLFKRATEDADADYRAEGQDVIQRIGKKMVPIISEYAQQNGFALIFDPPAVQLPVYYAAPQIDVTEEIIKRYDTANPVKADAGDAPLAPATRPAASAAKSSAATKPAEKPKP
jgi:outer membrane protein